MTKRLIALGFAALVASAGLAPHVRAAVIDTFEFANLNNWSGAGVTMSGRFTGTVEPDGLIGLADLSAFSVAGFLEGIQLIDLGLADLKLFSYDTKGGASSLGFTAFRPGAPEIACSGAPAVLDPRCNPGGRNPAATRAVMLNGGAFFAIAPDQTAVTLVSSVSTPEPSTWAMMLAGLAGLGLLGARRASKGPAAA